MKIETTGFNNNIKIKAIEPKEINVVLSSMRRHFYFLKKEDIGVIVKLFNLEDAKKIEPNIYQITVTGGDISLPDNFNIINILSRKIVVSIEEYE